MHLAQAFFESASRNATQTALFWGEHETDYASLKASTSWVAARLRQDFNVRKGDRIGIWLKNCPEFVPALFGALATGAVVVPINNFLTPPEVQFILDDAGIDVLITEESMREGLEKLREKRTALRELTVEQIPQAPSETSQDAPSADLVENDLAIIIYTSGTTGHPKGAMLSHGNLLANVESCRRVLLAVKEDRFVVLLPMFHSFMLTVCVLLPLLVGGSIVLVKSLHPPKNILAEIIHRRATLLPAVPQFFRMLCHAGVPPGLPLRLCISGGAPLPGEVLSEFTKRFPIPLLEGYGLSEASPVVSFTPVAGPWKAGSIGVPIADVEVSAQDDSGTILGANQTGEICVRGANVMQGYWNQPEETAKVMRNGWLLTGDVGHRDEDGYFYITDRKKDMLIVNGINVYPREIEEAIYRFPGVKEAAVIGVRDERKGEQPLAFVAANDGAQIDEGALLQFIRGQLAAYKIPRHVVFLPALPRNATSKVMKNRLREMAAETGPASKSC
jgi:long-chain acyl-CoA synthetase